MSPLRQQAAARLPESALSGTSRAGQLPRRMRQSTPAVGKLEYATSAPSRPTQSVFQSLSYLAPQSRPGEGDGVDHELVAGAAAEVAGDSPLDLVARGRGVALEQVERRHQHARRAVAALQRVRLVEGLLERVEGARRGSGHALATALARGEGTVGTFAPGSGSSAQGR